jgi:serine/threonine-protein kinase PknK
VELELPRRYEPLDHLGKGGGGEVWAVRDRHTGARYALKVLGQGASGPETAALVREAVALSGLEGLGLPRIHRFGRLPGRGRPFMVRELVEGRSLLELVGEGAPIEAILEALARAAEQLTLVHRAGMLHGDVKPANVIVTPEGRATLVDLGLAAPWQDLGTPPEGLTPRYAAPELLDGQPLTVRAEVFALGATLREALESRGAQSLEPGVLQELRTFALRATSLEPSQRPPSADEFASALRRRAHLPAPEDTGARNLPWPILGIEATAGRLLEAVHSLGSGDVLQMVGDFGSGRSVLLRRLGWSLGIEGRTLAWFDGAASSPPAAVQAELLECAPLSGAYVLVDDVEGFCDRCLGFLRDAQRQGARLVTVGDDERLDATRVFRVPPLEQPAAFDLMRRAVPSLTDHVLKRAYEAAQGRPGELLRLVRLIARDAVASPEDMERVLSAGASIRGDLLPLDPLERARYFLDRGRFGDAQGALASVGEESLAVAVERARLDLGLGDARAALERLTSRASDAERNPQAEEAIRWRLYLGRAHVSVGGYAQALDLLEPISQEVTPLGSEARAYCGAALFYLGRHAEARAALDEAVERAQKLDSPRAEALAYSYLGIMLQRDDRMDEARAAFERAAVAAEHASDAGVLGTVQLNLAGVLRISGDLAGAIKWFEAALDMGQRSGRRVTVRNALFNLANLDLYLGRLARARASIEALEEQRSQLLPVDRGRLLGLQAELAAHSGQSEQAVRLYQASAAAWEALGRGIDSAEARLEGVLEAAGSSAFDLRELTGELQRARADLGDAPAHRPLLLLAEARVAWLGGDEEEARQRIDQALAAAREAGQKEWAWRALELLAVHKDAAGQSMAARRDREEALGVLEDIGARLSKDLREVYWNDPRRRQLRASVRHQLAAAEADAFGGSLPGLAAAGTDNAGGTLNSARASVSEITTTPLEHRLARILEINAELAGELDLDRLTARVTEYAVDLLRAERGFVLLLQGDGTLSVHTSRTRGGDEPHAEFSRSIARQVMAKREPLISLSAREDARMAAFASVHQMMLRAVACVPILAPSGQAIGALYVETRHRAGAHFERELPTLRAFADQVAIAIETARLINENQRRADELVAANRELSKAKEHLRELLGDRTAQLKRARQKLRDARDTLFGHFGYQGLVGTSECMRRVYAFIDRIKDTDVPVLVTGESGTGKEMVAKAIHAASARAKARFLGVNCGAIPENLLESELFGHVRGAFTGADRDRKGLFRECEGGSVLLDEISEMPQKMQAGMLRVLQDRRVRKVGGTEEDPVDVRLIFATNRDLEAMVKMGKFREDLYYRIHVVVVPLPPLRQRAEDIPQLVDHFLGRFAARYKREKKTVSRDGLRLLMDHDWPGNVRQLEHVLLNAWVMSERPELEPGDFNLPHGAIGVPSSVPQRPEPLTPRSRPEGPPSTRRPGARSESSTASRRRTGKTQQRLSERERILKALHEADWNRVRAAELSGIPRRTFYRRLREYGIQ